MILVVTHTATPGCFCYAYIATMALKTLLRMTVYPALLLKAVSS